MMEDKLNPTNQFHPYQRVDATPHAEERQAARMRDVLNKNVEKVRELAGRFIKRQG
jgi:hypothetical protein